MQSHALRAAINTPIQGSAADVATAAMLSIDACQELKELGWKMLLQVLLLFLSSLYEMMISQMHWDLYSLLNPEVRTSALFCPVVPQLLQSVSFMRSTCEES